MREHFASSTAKSGANALWQALFRQDPFADVFGCQTFGNRKTARSDNADRSSNRVSGYRQIKSWLGQVKAASRHLRSIQKQPERVRRYFQHDPVKYAA